MQKIMEELLNPELREALAKEELSNVVEQEKFDKAKALLELERAEEFDKAKALLELALGEK